MKKIMFYLATCCFFLMACAGQEKPAAEVNQSPSDNVRLAQATANKDSVPVPKSKPNVIVDRSRQPSNMVADFPFDIALKTADGTETNSADIFKKNGKPTIVLFWLTTCGPCRMEMAAIKKEFNAWQDETDFNLVAISTDFQKNFPRFVEMTNKNEWQWETYHDTNREFRKVMPGGLNGLPQTFIFDKDGTIVYHKRKYRPGDEKTLYAKVKEIAMK